MALNMNGLAQLCLALAWAGQVFSLDAYYYSTHGGYDNACLFQYCEPCAQVGFYKKDCGGGYPGECAPCTGLPSGGVWTTHGWYNNSCEFECKDVYYRHNLLCYMNVSLVMSTPALNAKSYVNASLVQSTPVLNAKKSSSESAWVYTIGGAITIGVSLTAVVICGLCVMQKAASGTALRARAGSGLLYVNSHGEPVLRLQLKSKNY